MYLSLSCNGHMHLGHSVSAVVSVCSGLTEHSVLLQHRDSTWLGQLICFPSAAVVAPHIQSLHLTGGR